MLSYIHNSLEQRHFDSSLLVAAGYTHKSGKVVNAIEHSVSMLRKYRPSLSTGIQNIDQIPSWHYYGHALYHRASL